MIDSSVAMNWVMPDESDTRAEDLLDSVTVIGAVIPPLFRIEVANSLLVGVRRKRIASDYVGEAINLLEALPLRLDTQGLEHVWTTSVDIAAKHDLSLYDAIYLELALRLGLPLATLDTKLGDAAKQAGVAPPWPRTRD